MAGSTKAFGVSEDIGRFYWTPLEIFTKTFPRSETAPDQLRVIGWVLPHMDQTQKDNRNQTDFQSERRVRARIYGEEVSEKLRKNVVATLQQAAYEAVAPKLSPGGMYSLNSICNFR